MKYAPPNSALFIHDTPSDRLPNAPRDSDFKMSIAPRHQQRVTPLQLLLTSLPPSLHHPTPPLLDPYPLTYPPHLSPPKSPTLVSAAGLTVAGGAVLRSHCTVEGLAAVGIGLSAHPAASHNPPLRDGYLGQQVYPPPRTARHAIAMRDVPPALCVTPHWVARGLGDSVC